MSDDSKIQAFEPKTLEEAERLCGTLAKSALMPEHLRNKPGDVFVTFLTGKELGLLPMQAMRAISVVKGKPSLSADLMVALVKKRRDICEYLMLVESTATSATYKAKRVGEPDATLMSFTMQDAVAAGLTTSGMYQKFPKAMLRARAASAICRAVFPDLCMGLYDSDSGELADDSAPPAPSAPTAPTVHVVAPPAPVQRLERATEDAATEPEAAPGEPPASVALPSGPPSPGTEAYGNWMLAELEKAQDKRAVQKVGAASKGKVPESMRQAIEARFLSRLRELKQEGAH